MCWVQSVLLRAATPAQSGAVVLQAGGGEAVAIWFPPRARLDTRALLLRGGWAFSLLYTGWGNRSRLENWSAQVEPRRRRIVARLHEERAARAAASAGAAGSAAAAAGAAAAAASAGGAADAYYYLMLAAAREGLPRERAAAALRAVLQPVLDRADAQGAPCYVECTDPDAAQLPPVEPAAAAARPPGSSSAAARPASLGLAAVYDELGFRVLEGEDFSLFGAKVRILVRDAPARKQ